ncbi:MAG: hypothetical protein M0P16_00885 [Syntrophales bacterium]|jgi:tetratricopeptide (TPR) repeat protein|nr:hypothetical protein [Syntrophales bacterium]MCK9391627.1 hypothetical protein [Syntrophales bacterium]
MKQKVKVLVVLIFISMSFLFSGCATKVAVQMLQPAKYHQASLTKTVAVLPFSGKGGPEFSSEIESVISGVTIDGNPYFNLVDRVMLDKAISEMKLSTSGLIEPATAVKLGKMVQAQGIYTGSVSVANTKDQRYTERREECERIEQKYNPKTKENENTGRCLSWRRWTVNCVKRTANFSAVPKLIAVETGRVFYSQNISGNANAAGCEDGTPPSDEHTLLGQAKAQALKTFRNDIAPYYQTSMIKIMESNDKISVSLAKDKLKEGVNWADKKRLDAACNSWGEAYNLAPNSPSLLYNLGVCAESRADFKAALDLYKKADNELGKPDDDITLAILRADNAVKNQKKLEEQVKSMAN